STSGQRQAVPPCESRSSLRPNDGGNEAPSPQVDHRFGQEAPDAGPYPAEDRPLELDPKGHLPLDGAVPLGEAPPNPHGRARRHDTHALGHADRDVRTDRSDRWLSLQRELVGPTCLVSPPGIRNVKPVAER